MIPDIGQACLVAALFVLLLQMSAFSIPRLMPLTGLLIFNGLQFLLVTTAFLCLALSYYHSDFSVQNVFENSHTAKPTIYKITGTWGNHEGSILLWGWVLSLFGLLLPVTRLKSLVRPAVVVQSLMLFGVLLFILATSNPFIRLNPAPPEGLDLNPLLQDIGLAIHPPMLYLGYVGFSAVFAQAMAGLVIGKMDKDWARAVHPWILCAWGFLTLGIGLGSWWAYRELGWGGWWFWDPVENASLFPWLAGTALLHSNLVLMKRGMFGRWVVLLAILTFSLSLVGTFLVRSGLITSVHSFSVAPERGMFILAYIVVIVVLGLTAYAARYNSFPSGATVQPLSREMLILLNNLFLLTACATVVVGTIYPLLLELMTGQSVSVGPPYYHLTVVPMLLPMFWLAALALILPWVQGKKEMITAWLQKAGLLAGGILILLWITDSSEWLWAFAGFTSSAWLFFSCITVVRKQWPNILTANASWWGALFGHGGLAIFIAGVTAVSLWSIEIQRPLEEGKPVELGAYTLDLQSVEEIKGENFVAQRASFKLQEGGHTFSVLSPEIRLYPARATQTIESAIYSSPLRDIYVVLGQSADGKHLAVRAYVKPLMSWIWAGFLLAALGGMLSAIRLPKKE